MSALEAAGMAARCRRTFREPGDSGRRRLAAQPLVDAADALLSCGSFRTVGEGIGVLEVVARAGITVSASEVTGSVAGVVRVLVAIVVTTFAAMEAVVESRTETANGAIAAVREDVEPDSDSVVLRGFLGTFG